MNRHWDGISKLSIVAGHAVYIGCNFEHIERDENWFLQSFQQGEPPFYIEHIREGVALTHNDPDKSTLLVFSGGQTRLEAGPRSEALSYWLVADSVRWWDHVRVKMYSTTEEYARDSFENILFSICRFFECVKRWPKEVSVVSWEFKRKRFQHHWDHIWFPEKDNAIFTFIGVNDPVDLEKAEEGELENSLRPFENDPYGTGAMIYEVFDNDGKLKKKVDLGQKRKDRNPFCRVSPYRISCPDMEGILDHKGPKRYLTDDVQKGECITF